ncbi:MAG TPA: hypothetical protein ENL20_01500 [Candidatus Cloacimonetes bacterium]|nr:hypothetical protein [Candidatus Cloacimonadota bacterium]
MARITVRKTIPRYKPLKLIKLAQDIIKKDEEMGDDSPLKTLKMDILKQNLTTAIENRKESIKLRKQSESLMQISRRALGTDLGQNANTANTVYNFITIIRDLLSVIYRGNEEKLSLWGFNVVIGTSMPHRKKKKENE